MAFTLSLSLSLLKTEGAFSLAASNGSALWAISFCITLLYNLTTSVANVFNDFICFFAAKDGRCNLTC